MVVASIDTTKVEEEQSRQTEGDFARSMDALIKKTPAPPKLGDIVEGHVVAIGKNSVYVDLGVFGTGIIYGREYLNAKDLIKKIVLTDSVKAKVVDTETDHGYLELSMREAKQAVIWTEAEAAIKNKDLFELTVKEANKGGLMLDWQGILGFLPASQLKPDHYPRVDDGDKEKIYEELRKLIGEKIKVSIISIDPKEGKLIFSEKSGDLDEKQKIIENYRVGDVIEGTVTGAVDFGIFVKIEEGLEGLVHISEIDWALVEDPRKIYNVGDVIKAKIIEIKDDKVSLSVKALSENPWKKISSTYKTGDVVDGVVIKFNKYGALVSIVEGVAGLIHVSEFETEDALQKALELGKTYKFTITLFEPKEERMTLTLAGKEEKDPEEEKTS